MGQWTSDMLLNTSHEIFDVNSHNTIYRSAIFASKCRWENLSTYRLSNFIKIS